MGKRYSIYFDSRKIVIANQVDIRFYGNGLIIKYDEPVELVKLLDFFILPTSSGIYLFTVMIPIPYSTFCASITKWLRQPAGW